MSCCDAGISTAEVVLVFLRVTLGLRRLTGRSGVEARLFGGLLSADEQ